MMDYESAKELEQMRNLDKLRKLILGIFRNHIGLLVISFLLVLLALVIFISMQVKYSPTRYLARLTLCFQPKHKGKIGQYDDKYILRLLNRRSTRRNFSTKGDGRDLWRKRVAENIHISTDKKQPHTFSIELYAKSETDAVDFINEFASVCIQEYSTDRAQDLKRWKAVLEEEKAELDKNIQEYNVKITELLAPLQMVVPEKDHERLRLHMNELQSASTKLGYALENLNRRKEQLESELSSVNPMLLTHQKEIKDLIKEVENMNREVELNMELYTEENPKMIALLARRNAVQKRLDMFLKDKQIKSVDQQMLRSAETLSAELKNVQNELDAKQSEKRVLDGEIADCGKRYQLFNECQPELQRLMHQRRTLQESKQRLDESIAEIDYMKLMVKEDLFINERARSAYGNQPFSKKNIIICIVVAIILTGFFATLIALVEFLFGTVADAKELILYDEFHYLGVLPTSEKLFASHEREEITFNALFHKMQQLGPQVVFTTPLLGAKIIPQFYDSLKWNFAMEGKRMLLINLIHVSELEETEDSDPGSGSEEDPVDTMIVTFSNRKCFLPVSNQKFLLPSEMELLKSDLKLLKEQHFDCIFIRHTFPLRHSQLLLEQIASMCDAGLVAVGAGKTRRKSLRRLMNTQTRINIPIMTILTDSTKETLNKDLKVETES